MDKQSYKELLEEEFSRNRFLEKELNRLQILVARYSDEANQLKRLVENTPNDMSLGSAVRSVYHEKDKKSNT